MTERTTKRMIKMTVRGDFMVPPALVQKHRDMLGTLIMTLSALLKEFKGYCHD
ncbi:hypothetical protein ID866_11128 [Astraeus odoratus]|nr:hypothetical protein ID866_11128 [Astraeus odoratus]